MAVDRLPQFGAGAKVIESEIFGETADFVRQPDLVQAEQAVAVPRRNTKLATGPIRKPSASITGTPKPSSGAEKRSGSPAPRTLKPGKG